MTTEAARVLTESERRLYARHVLLPELGPSGQARLCASAVSIARDADPAAAEVARDYLQRAGLSLSEGDAASAVAVPTREAVRRLAGDAALEDSAAWLAGAWAAVETIKRCAGVGTEAALAEVLIDSEERG